MRDANSFLDTIEAYFDLRYKAIQREVLLDYLQRIAPAFWERIFAHIVGHFTAYGSSPPLLKDFKEAYEQISSDADAELQRLYRSLARLQRRLEALPDPEVDYGEAATAAATRVEELSQRHDRGQGPFCVQLAGVFSEVQKENRRYAGYSLGDWHAVSEARGEITRRIQVIAEELERYRATLRITSGAGR